MLMVAPDEGKPILLDAMMRLAFSSNFFIKLFTDDITPDNDSVFADFTGATFTGSDAITLTRGSFDAAFATAGVGYIEYPTPPTWVCSGAGPETCYGWYMWVDGTSLVVFAQRFDTPRVMDTGATESLTPFVIALQPIT